MTRLSFPALLSFLLAFSVPDAFGKSSAAADPLWANRNSETGARANYDAAKSRFESERTYENAWKYARAAYFYGDNYVRDLARRKAFLTEGKGIAEIATNLGYDRPEGHYYLAVCIGLWAEANGVLNSLFAAPDILKEATKSVDIDPEFLNAGSLMLRARVYQQAPGGISVGDLKKSEADYEKCLEYAPRNRVAHRFYAELLLNTGRKDKAREIIEKGIAIPPDPSDRVIEEKEIAILKKMREKV